MAFTALYDANLFYSAPLRDLMVRLARMGRFRARWSETIHEEWVRALLKNRPELDPSKLRRTRELVDRAVPDCLVTGHEQLIEAVGPLPDPDDRHVLAAAIVARADVIVTWNVTDFPKATLAPYGIDVQDPDTFVGHLLDLALPEVRQVVREQRLALKNPPKNAADFLIDLEGQQLTRTVAILRAHVDVL